jgi:hypothetical protein
MRIVEDFWLKNGRTAERAAASILGDLTKVGAPDDLISLAQQTSTHLAVPPEERKSTIPAQIGDLRKRLNAYSLGPQGQQFFYNAGGLTYDMDLLGQDASKQDHVEAKVEDSRKAILPMATTMATQCATLTDCKVRALSYISDAAGLLQQSPFLPTDGEALRRLCDQIGIALGTEEPLTSR